MGYIMNQVNDAMSARYSIYSSMDFDNGLAASNGKHLGVGNSHD